MSKVARVRLAEVLLLLQTVAVVAAIAPEPVVYHCMPLTAEETAKFREREVELLNRVEQLRDHKSGPSKRSTAQVHRIRAYPTSTRG